MSMPSISYNGEVIFELPEAKTDKQSSLLFALPKSGSKMVRGILRKLAHQSGVVPVGPEGRFKHAGIPRDRIPASISEVFKPTGYFYYLNNVPTYDIPIDVPTVVHVRDPRDVLVSKYYSLRNSHPLPGDSIMPDRLEAFAQRREMLNRVDVDEGVLALAGTKALRNFREIADRHGVMLSRYEDMVYTKAEWAAKICQHFDWDRPKAAINRAVEPFDVFPESEQPDQHVRQVHPGNYKHKLKPETIAILDEMLADDIAALGYKPS